MKTITSSILCVGAIALLASCVSSPASGKGTTASLVAKLPSGGVSIGGVRGQVVSVDTPASFDVDGGTATYSIGYGSGVEYLGPKDGNLVFMGITDRGPNLDGPAVNRDGATLASKFFPAPAFVPQMVVFEIDPATLKGKAVDKLLIRNPSGKTITGFPLPQGLVGSTAEVAFSLDMKDLGTDAEGLDPEAVRRDARGNYWICDEYGPFIAKIDGKTGSILEKYSPGKGLPAIIAKRQPNRGMEGLAITPNGKVYGIVQSILDYDGKLKENKAGFVRLVELDPKTGSTRQFAVPIDVEVYKAAKDAKLGDLIAINDTDFLLIEQGADAKKVMRNLVYRISIKDSTDITDRKVDGFELEKLGPVSELEKAGIKAASKKLVIDLRQHGWNVEKAEGLALIDSSHLLVVSDNDFGIAAEVSEPAVGADGKPVTSSTAYTYKDGVLTYGGQATGSKITATSNNETASFMLFTFDTPLD